MKLKQLLIPLMFSTLAFSAQAIRVNVWTMNNTDKILKLVNKETGENIDVGDIDGWTYDFTADPGLYEFSMYEPDGETFIGALEYEIVDDGKEPTIMLYRATVTVNNSNTDGSGWIEDEDYTVTVGLKTQQNDPIVIRTGHNSAGTLTMLTRSGTTIAGTAIPSEAKKVEGFMEYSATRAVTNNSTLDLTMPMGVTATVTLPKDAGIQIGAKKAHFVDFTLFEPVDETVEGDNRIISYRVLPNSTINYRTWREGGLTRAGYFTSGKDATTTSIFFIGEDYEAFDPKEYNQDVNSNNGYETGDIFINGNERGHISLAVGESFKAHAMRSWQLTDNSTGNYFMEPDFHYTVIGTDGKPLEGVLELNSKEGSAWTEIKALAEGTAIVLVTYDAMGVNYYSNGVRKPYMGGEIWGAIWPENTAVFVVTVGQQESFADPLMIVNEDYNTGTLKVAGKYVDAEHDVFYYLDSEEGFKYTFTPENVEDITIAYPEITETSVSYNGFTSEGVIRNTDGSWTVLLKHGRQIVRMTDASGASAYQVIRGRKCHREIENTTRPGSDIYYPGDKVKIQYSGLFHPANKLAGIYNMSAYVTYNGIPNGTSLILGAGQYTFGSAPGAQAVTIDIPADFDTEANPTISLTDGVIQVSGYGDPVGNHRFIDPENGRNANFTAQAHKTYFGSIPDTELSVHPYNSSIINVESDVEDFGNARWFNLQGIEVAAPDAGSHGVFIRVTNGKTEKIVL